MRLNLLILVLCVSVAARGQDRGTIEGTLVDENGRPVANAQVRLVPALPAIHRVIQLYGTDRGGHFVIENVRFGSYTIFAGKQDLGYPVMAGPFYGIDGFPIVNLQRGSPSATVTIHLPPRAGAIQSVSVIDALTGNKIDSAAITLKRVADPNAFIQTSTTVAPILVPSNIEVSTEITSSGYKTWPATDDPKDAGRIRLEPGKAVKLDVKLQPQGSKGKSIAVFSPGVLLPRPKPLLYSDSRLLSTEVKLFNVQANNISVPLKMLANEYHVPIGFESLPSRFGKEKTKSVQIDVEAGTVRDVLDAIVAADPAYAWEETNSAVENVFPKNHADSLPDVVVSEYSEKDVNRDQAIDALIKTHEVEEWMQEKGVSRQESQSAMPSLPKPSEIIYQTTYRGATMRTILDAILTGTQAHFWQFSQYGDHNQYFSITMTE